VQQQYGIDLAQSWFIGDRMMWKPVAVLDAGQSLIDNGNETEWQRYSDYVAYLGTRDYREGEGKYRYEHWLGKAPGYVRWSQRCCHRRGDARLLLGRGS